MLVTLYNLVVPDDRSFLGETDHLGEARISMIWLMDRSAHLISDYWQQKETDEENKRFRVLESHEPSLPAPQRDWTKQLCLGYSWLRDCIFYGERMPPRIGVGITPAPKANFVKLKEWLDVAEKKRGSSPLLASMFPNPFLRFV